MTRLRPLISVRVITLFLSASALLCGTAIVVAQRPPTASDKPAVAQEQPVTPQNPEKTEEKEAFTAWGKEVGGLQAGLGFKSGEKRAYSQGETVTIVARIRNVGKEAVEFRHIWSFFLENPPKLTDPDGKVVKLPNYRTRDQRLHMPRSCKVAPGKEVELYEWEFVLQPKGEISSRSFIHGTGKHSLQCERVVGPTWLNPNHPNPTLSNLATGKLELEIESETSAAAEGALPAGVGQGDEAAQDGGAEKLYRVMEKKVSEAKSLQVALVGEMDSPAIKGKVNATIYATQRNKSRMEIDLEFGGISNKQLFISDGKARYMKQGDTGTLDANPKKGPEEGKLIARIGITGAMMMARAVKPGEEEPEFDFDKDAPVTNFKLGAKEKVGDSPAQVVTYQLDFNGKSAQISVWIDTKTQLPLKRVVAVDPDAQMFRITETYSTFALDPKLEPNLFEIPKR
jgi:hypothetical protein